MPKAKPLRGGSNQVNDFMANLEHPFKAQVELVREIIKNVNPKISEQIKWNAPSFSYKGESLVTFNLWEKKRIHLVFHNSKISKVRNELLEGNYDDRRMAYFADETEIRAKQKALERALKDLIKLQTDPKEKV
ncbi:MAG TPA: DUF1801 domain-containing protein [Anaerolineales bacterium]|nr:DUF1801 domain-containing protein [Anaerolineales bacterium]